MNHFFVILNVLICNAQWFYDESGFKRSSLHVITLKIHQRIAAARSTCWFDRASRRLIVVGVVALPLAHSEDGRLVVASQPAAARERVAIVHQLCQSLEREELDRRRQFAHERVSLRERRGRL